MDIRVYSIIEKKICPIVFMVKQSQSVFGNVGEVFLAMSDKEWIASTPRRNPAFPLAPSRPQSPSVSGAGIAKNNRE